MKDIQRTLARGTRIVSKDRPCQQQYILIIGDILLDPEEPWKGTEYHVYPEDGGFEAVVTEVEMFELFRQVHPSELERVPWERMKFSLEDGCEELTLYDGLYRGARWNGWAVPWLTHESLMSIRDLWHKMYVELIAKGDEDAAEDCFFFIFDEIFGWVFWNGNIKHMEFLHSTVVEIDGEQITVWNAACGLTWTDWTEEGLATYRAEEDS